MVASDTTVAVVGAVGIIIAAIIAAVPTTLAVRRARQDITARLGKVNGEGNLLEIAEHNKHRGDRTSEDIAILRNEVQLVSDKADAHADLDRRRFAVLHEHFDIPFPDDPDTNEPFVSAAGV